MNWLKRVLSGKPKKDPSFAYRCPSNLAPGMTRTGMTEFLRPFAARAARFACAGATDPVPRRIWQFWWQGADRAPALIKTCFASVRKFFPDYEIVIIDQDNCARYIDLPETILRRFNEGTMPHALLSDYIRAALLARHGGIWIDPTVFVSGPVPPDIAESEFFVFSSPYWMSQAPNPPSPDFLGALRFFASRPSLTLAGSFWWITSAPASAPALVLKDLQEEYWRNHDRAIDYLQTYDFLTIAFAANPQCRACWLKMPKHATVHAQLLQEYLPEPFDPQLYDALLKLSPVHKLTHKIPENVLPRDSFCHHLLGLRFA